MMRVDWLACWAALLFRAFLIWVLNRGKRSYNSDT